MLSRQFTLLGALMLALIPAISCQNTNKPMNQETAVNPLLCDPKQGTCEIPGATAAVNSTNAMTASEKPVKVVYFTDPICSACWGIEPQLRRMKMEFGDYIEVEYFMGGLLPSWEGFNGGGISKPTDVYHHWEEVSHYYGMPMVGDVWIKDPLPSSYPPSIAFKAAQMQDKDKALKFLRRLREMVFVEARNITRAECIAEAAGWAGLDTKQLEKDSQGPAVQLFESDLKKAREMGVRGFPTVFFLDATGNRLTVYGARGYDEFSSSIQRLASEAKSKSLTSEVMVYFEPFKSLTSKELSVFTNKPVAECEALLKQLEKDGRISAIETKNGNLYRLKS